MKCAKSVLALVLFASSAGAEASHEEVSQLAFRFFPKQFRECSEYADWEAATKATLEDVDPWEQFPVAIVRGNWWWDFENGVPEDWAKDSVANRFFGGSRYVVYLPMRFPGDPNEYLMLCYNNFEKSFWLWLRRAPGKEWEQVQSSGMFLEYLAGEGFGGALFAEPLVPLACGYRWRQLPGNPALRGWPLLRFPLAFRPGHPHASRLDGLQVQKRQARGYYPHLHRGNDLSPGKPFGRYGPEHPGS
jgi:hypothetical protein